LIGNQAATDRVLCVSTSGGITWEPEALGTGPLKDIVAPAKHLV